MQTNFSLAQLADPDIAASEKILRTCVHCGFCTATCPTYLLLGDELDSPRGRIYLIKDMLENDRRATAEVVNHVDRCLSCLACMTTCPSGVHYMHLVDHARASYREDLPAAARRPRVRAAARARPAVAAACSARRCCWRAARPAACAASSRAFRGSGRRLARRCWRSRRRACRSRDQTRPRHISGRRRERQRRRVALLDRLRAGRACARDQRGDDPAAQPRRRRGGAGRGRGLLRRAGASHGPRGRGAAPGARQYRRLDARDRRRRASTRSSSTRPAAARR